MKNLKIGVRLGIGFAVTLALLIAIAVVGVTRISALNAEVEGLVNDKFPKTVLANDIIDAINISARALRNAALVKTPEEAAKELARLPEQSKVITERIEQLEKTITSDKGKELLKRLSAARAAYVPEMQKTAELARTGKRDETAAALMTSVRKVQNEYIAATVALIDFQTELMAKAGKDADAMADGAERILTILAVIASLLTAVFGWFITRSITRPVNEALHVTQRLADGDLTVSITDISKDGGKTVGEVLMEVEPEDLIKYGLIPEFVGRLPVVATLTELDEGALVRILTEPKNAIAKQFNRLFEMEGSELEFREEALRAIARKAMERKTGARGLRTILEHILLDTMYDLPSMQNVHKVVVDDAVVEGRNKPYFIYENTERRTAAHD